MQFRNNNIGLFSKRAGILSMAAASALMMRGAYAATDVWTSTSSGTTGTTAPNQLWLNTH